MRYARCLSALAALFALIACMPLALAGPPASSIDAAVAVGIGVANAGESGATIDLPVAAEVAAPEPRILRWDRRCGPDGCKLDPVYADPIVAHAVRSAVSLDVLGAMIDLAQPARDSKAEAPVDPGRARRARFFIRRR